jgi:hypothetical protein
VSIGETVDAMDFISGSDILSRERTGDEVAWSIGNPVPWPTIAAAFGLAADAAGAEFTGSSGDSSIVSSDGELSSQTVTIIVILIIVVIVLLVLCGACDDCGGGGGGGIFFGGGSSRGGK